MIYKSKYTGEKIDASIGLIENQNKELIELKNNFNSLETSVNSFLDIVYPIGSIYLSINNISPAKLFGIGTWEQIKDRFLLSAGDTYTAGSTGGEATHTLTVNEMPSHLHTQHILFNQTGYGNTSYSWEAYLKTVSETSTPIASTSGTPGTLTNMNTRRLRDSGNAGSSQPHNNMPPYLVVYMWKRTA